MKKLRVFVVEDDQDFAESLVEILEDEGCEVEVASNGEAAIARVAEQDFDLGLIDVKLPGMNGVDCFRQIHEKKPAIKVVMMTAYSVERLLSQAIEEGAVGVLHKPFEVERLTEILKKTESSPVVLIADDDADVVESIRDILAAEGYSVRKASTGQEAVEMIMADGIDVLLLDLRMPVLNGLQVYQNLKKHKRTVPTIIITGYSNEEAKTIKKLRKLSVKKCLAKPVEPEKLVEMIKTIRV